MDIEENDATRELFDEFNVDKVVNLAAEPGALQSLNRPLDYFATNAIGNLNLLEVVRSHGVSKFVLASTSSIYAGNEMTFEK